MFFTISSENLRNYPNYANISPLYEEKIACFRKGGLILAEFKIFRKSFLNVSGSRKIALKAWKIFPHFFAVIGEKFQNFLNVSGSRKIALKAWKIFPHAPLVFRGYRRKISKLFSKDLQLKNFLILSSKDLLFQFFENFQLKQIFFVKTIAWFHKVGWN